jgi:hypothetical protein
MLADPGRCGAGAGCQASPVSPSSASSLLTAMVQGATLDGPVASEYSGAAWVMTTPNARRRPRCSCCSHRDPGLRLARASRSCGRDRRSPPGYYALGGDAPGAPKVVYTQRRGDITYRYGAQSGELVVTGASHHRLTGTFSFSGVFIGTCTTTSVGAVSCTHAGPAEAEALVLTAPGRSKPSGPSRAPAGGDRCPRRRPRSSDPDLVSDSGMAVARIRSGSAGPCR